MRRHNPSTENDHLFSPVPHAMNEAAFVKRFGAIYEHAPWVPRGTWQHGLTAREDTVGKLAAAMSGAVERAGDTRQLELIRAHPDLGGKAAIAGKLTAASTREQAAAGLAACTPQQFVQLQRLNAEYAAKFGFPFIVAVAGLSREVILEGMAQRLRNDEVAEHRRALDEIHRIAWFRLLRLAQAPGAPTLG